MYGLFTNTVSSWPLMACHERRQRKRLETWASKRGGLIIALDGLESEAGKPHLWVIHELSTGLPLRNVWMNRQTQEAFGDFLAPLCEPLWPILAVLSDQQTGLQQTVANKLSDSPHPLCQTHSLRNLAKPRSEADVALKAK